MEIWKDIPGYDGLYQASNLGNIRSLDRMRSNHTGEYLQKGKQMKPALSSSKYLSLCLRDGRGPKSFMVHRLVASAFHANPLHLPQVNHKDGNKMNNRADNLEWCTRQQNVDHGYANGLMHKHKGTTHHFAKLTPNDVFNIRFNREILNTPYRIIAEFYGISHAAVINIIKGKNWSHV